MSSNLEALRVGYEFYVVGYKYEFILPRPKSEFSFFHLILQFSFTV